MILGKIDLQEAAELDFEVEVFGTAATTALEHATTRTISNAPVAVPLRVFPR